MQVYTIYLGRACAEQKASRHGSSLPGGGTSLSVTVLECASERTTVGFYCVSTIRWCFAVIRVVHDHSDEIQYYNYGTNIGDDTLYPSQTIYPQERLEHDAGPACISSFYSPRRRQIEPHPSSMSGISASPEQPTSRQRAFGKNR